MSANYKTFLENKRVTVHPSGFQPDALNAKLFEFQRDIDRWALSRGKAALFEDCGLGKTPQQLEWAHQVAMESKRPVLILAPLAVSKQTEREGAKFDIPVKVVTSDIEIRKGANVYVTNYEKLQHFDPSRFGGVVLDESSILKSFTGATRNLLIEKFAKTPMKLCCTATPAPNDFMELGNHSEFLGVLTRTEMLSTFFVHDGGDTAKWRLKGHAEEEYWKWICGWAVMIRKPSDLGYSDEGFELPALHLHHHVVEGKPSEGFLFQVEARTLMERRQARRASLEERVKMCADLVLKYRPCGSQNTPPIASEKPAPILNTPLVDVSKGHGHQKKIEPTCATGTSATASGSGSTTAILEISNGVDSGHETSTPTIQSTGKGAKQKSKSGSNGTPASDSPNGSKPSILPLTNTTECSNGRTGNALSAEHQTPGESGDYSASTATSVLDTSEMFPNVLRGPLATSDDQWIIWCGLNDEQDAIAKLCGDQCVSIYGSLSDVEKESRLDKWLKREKRILITKASIFGFGLNFQQCSNVVFLGLDDSYETYYQAIRRCWRYGQKNPVNCHIITSESEGAVVKNIERKEKDATRMAVEMAKHMSVYSTEMVHGTVRTANEYKASRPMALPEWIKR